MSFTIMTATYLEPVVYQSVCNIVFWDAGKEDLPAPVISHWWCKNSWGSL